MIYETEEQHDLETEYFDKEHAGKEQTGKYMDSRGEEIQPQTLRELLDAQANDRTYTQAALAAGLQMSIFTFETDGAFVLISPIDGAS